MTATPPTPKSITTATIRKKRCGAPWPHAVSDSFWPSFSALLHSLFNVIFAQGIKTKGVIT